MAYRKRIELIGQCSNKEFFRHERGILFKVAQEIPPNVIDYDRYIEQVKINLIRYNKDEKLLSLIKCGLKGINEL